MPRIYTIVGPSGVGKDTLMDAVCTDPQILRIRRAITRDANAGGEVFTGLTEEEFETRANNGDFILHWRAHGLRYGVPRAAALAAKPGQTVIFNGSRAMLAEAVKTLPDLRVIHITARPEVLARRLAARGRESAAEIEQRLRRAQMTLPSGLDITEIDNSGDLETAARALRVALQPVRA